jgi:hypothetical protein
MRATIDLPDELLRWAKTAAAARGISLRRFFTEVLESGLRRDPAPPAPRAWRALAGALAPLRAETRRIAPLIEAEFEPS